MDDVIENLQVTFEEDGINQQTLNDLRTVGCLVSFATITRPRWAELSHIPVSS